MGLHSVITYLYSKTDTEKKVFLRSPYLKGQFWAHLLTELVVASSLWWNCDCKVCYVPKLQWKCRSTLCCMHVDFPGVWNAYPFFRVMTLDVWHQGCVNSFFKLVDQQERGVRLQQSGRKDPCQTMGENFKRYVMDKRETIYSLSQVLSPWYMQTAAMSCFSQKLFTQNQTKAACFLFFTDIRTSNCPFIDEMKITISSMLCRVCTKD